MGYTPLFDSVFTGSLFGQYPDSAAWCFFLALCDSKGEVDRTPEYIAGVTGMPLQDLLGCIERFLKPDPRSRSQLEQGRRLVPIDPARDWGWRLVNVSTYRERARDGQRVADGRHAERVARWRAKQREKSDPDVTRSDPVRPPVTACDSTQTPDSRLRLGIGEREALNAPATPPKRAPKRLPDDLSEVLTPEVRTWIAIHYPHVDPARELEAFADHWRQDSTAKARKLDWPAAMRTWVRRSVQFAGRPNGAPVPVQVWRPPEDDDPATLNDPG